jgi:hypothetical protein
MKIAAKIMKPNGILASLEPRNALLAAWTVATNITNHIGASRKSIAQPSVALVTGGAVIGFDDRCTYRSRPLAHGAFTRRGEAIRK